MEGGIRAFRLAVSAAIWAQSELVASRGEGAVGPRDLPGAADAASGRHLEVASVNAPVVEWHPRSGFGLTSARKIGDRGFRELSASRNGKPTMTATGLALVEPEGEGVVRLALPRRPLRLLAGHHGRQPVEIGDHALVDSLVEGEQPGLVGEELAEGHAFLALLGELRPVHADALVIVEQAS